MTTKKYGLSIDAELKLIGISGISSTALDIDFSGDVDFTRLVAALTESIDSKSLLAPQEGNDTSDDKVLMLILETISSIIEEYNITVKGLADEDDVLVDAVSDDV